MHQLIQESTPRIVRIGDNPGCPCGGTHVLNISDITKVKVCNPFTSYTTQQKGWFDDIYINLLFYYVSYYDLIYI